MTLCIAILGGIARAHPEPDIPVRSQFMKDGTCTVTLELDPRCFVAEPITTPYTIKKDLDAMTPERKEELRKLARDLIKNSIEFLFEPTGKVEPDFAVEFSSINDAPLKTDEDPVMLACKWKTAPPAGAKGWRLHALKTAKFAVIFRNYIEGVEQPRFSVLFPGETSFLLELNRSEIESLPRGTTLLRSEGNAAASQTGPRGSKCDAPGGHSVTALSQLRSHGKFGLHGS